MLVELARQLDEIAHDVGAGEARIGDVGEQAMEAVAELVEHGSGLVERQQRRLALGRLVEIAGVDDERNDLAAELLLIAERGHPGAAALARPGEEIAVEQADGLAAASPPPRRAHRGDRPGRRRAG